MEQERKIILSFLLILSISSLVRTVLMLWNSNLPDFKILYDSSLFAFKHQNPYTNNALSTPVNYPPITLMLLYWVTLIPFAVASKIWILLSVASLLGTIYVINKIIPASWSLNIMLFSLTVFSFPFKFTLGMGQVNLILLFLLALFFFFVSKRKDYFSAVSLSLAISIKLFPIFLLLPLILKRRWKIISSTLIFIIFLFFIAFLYVGKEANNYYFQNTLFHIFSKRYEYYYNQSVTGFLSRFGIPDVIIFLTRIALFGISLVLIMKKRMSLILSLSLFVVLILLINHFSWQHHLVLLLLPYYIILKYTKAKEAQFLLFVSYLLIALNIKHPSAFESLWFGNLTLSHGFFGILLLWIIYILSV